ncbi:MAG: Holliday junction branch migration protein RuvA [Alphaproteobacteria bacterium]|nr:Holliday junction branch migration protein RuvA [Alphaproteobacteria bacterium]
MIAKLKGRIEAIGEASVVIDVGGVGYLVFCSGRTLRDMPPVGAAASLHIETHVREDHIHLYGFFESLERDWFRLLQTVQGVGAKVALAILSAVTPAELATAIAAQDKAPLTNAHGVGAKLAQRVVAELKDKVPSLLTVAAAGAAALPAATAAGLLGPAAADAVSALVNLGYRRVDAFSAVAAVSRAAGNDQSVEQLIRGGLKELAQAGGGA